VSHGFEDSAISDPTCGSRFGIWVEYGGKSVTGTVYCCGANGDRSRPSELNVDGIPIPLIDDALFRKFDALLHEKPETMVHATVVGMFFAGRPGSAGRGYGHMGCCSLLAIQQVLSVDPWNRNDLDYSTRMEEVRGKVGCWVKTSLTKKISEAVQQEKKTGVEPREEPWGKDAIDAQRAAEGGQRSWAFDNPRRVATEALADFSGVDPGTIHGMKLQSKSQARYVYVRESPDKKAKYMVIVNRPYWLTFYAKDPRKIAWVVSNASEASCEKD
jgi:hypothetical protein